MYIDNIRVFFSLTSLLENQNQLSRNGALLNCKTTLAMFISA